MKRDVVIWKESIYKNGFKCKCGALLSDDKISPNENVGMSEDENDPRCFCMKCKNLVAVMKFDVETDLEGDQGLYKGQVPFYDEVDCWAFGIGNLTMNPFFRKKQREILYFIKGLEGFVGITPMYPHGTLVIFDTENNAKGGRNLLRAKDIRCGGISTVKVPKWELNNG